MHLSLFSVRAARGHSAGLETPTQEYLQRLQMPWRAEARVFRTEEALLDAIAQERRAAHTTVWLLDSRGKTFSSEQFAAALQAVRIAGCRRLIAAIGPANGWSDAARAGAAGAGMLVSLGPLTLPHELARLLLAEQLYRATTILAGHPYHLGHE